MLFILNNNCSCVKNWPLNAVLMFYCTCASMLTCVLDKYYICTRTWDLLWSWLGWYFCVLDWRGLWRVLITVETILFLNLFSLFCFLQADEASDVCWLHRGWAAGRLGGGVRPRRRSVLCRPQHQWVYCLIFLLSNFTPITPAPCPWSTLQCFPFPFFLHLTVLLMYVYDCEDLKALQYWILWKKQNEIIKNWFYSSPLVALVLVIIA